ncbi:MAG TPA: alpha/beta fold hydrolase, partial [Marmoricola sp.]
MAVLETHGIAQYYETHGDPANPPVLLIAGLGGTGASWASQIHRFAERYFVLVPDQRGTGRSTHAADGHTTAQLAADLIDLLDFLSVSPAHVVGSSTGGAIAQHIVLARPDLARSLTLASSFARFDAFMRREFDVRRRLAAEWDRRSVM